MEEARKAFEAPNLDSKSCILAVNVAYVSGDVDEIAAQAANALRRVNYLVEPTDRDDDSAVFSTLIALAVLSASARSGELADAIRTLARVHRRRGVFQSDPENEIRVALVAAAAFAEREDWARFAGEWITEVAFELTNCECAGGLLLMVRRLMHLETSLTRTAKSFARRDGASRERGISLD